MVPEQTSFVPFQSCLQRTLSSNLPFVHSLLARNCLDRGLCSCRGTSDCCIHQIRQCAPLFVVMGRVCIEVFEYIVSFVALELEADASGGPDNACFTRKRAMLPHIDTFSNSLFLYGSADLILKPDRRSRAYFLVCLPHAPGMMDDRGYRMLWLDQDQSEHACPRP